MPEIIGLLSSIEVVSMIGALTATRQKVNNGITRE